MAKSHFVRFAVYALANSLHFAINADFIAFYPYMPGWIGPGTVHRAWILVNSIGLAGVLLSMVGQRFAANCMLAAYGLLGLDGLLHYSLDLCKDHDLLTNFAIGGEALFGLAPCIASVSDIWKSSSLWVACRRRYKIVLRVPKPLYRLDTPHSMPSRRGALRPGSPALVKAIRANKQRSRFCFTSEADELSFEHLAALGRLQSLANGR
jgi:hypothetical protein